MTLRYDTRSRVSTYTQSWVGGEPDFGAFESIGTITVGSGGSTSISFSSIPQTYKHLQLRYMTRNASGVYYVKCQINGETSATYYYDHWLFGTGAAASSGSDNTNTGGLLPRASATANIFTVGIVDFLDYTNTNKYKTVRALGGHDTNGGGYVELNSFLYSKDTTAISSLNFIFNSGNHEQYSHFALYGIKG